MGSTARAGQDESDGQRRARATRQPHTRAARQDQCVACMIDSARASRWEPVCTPKARLRAAWGLAVLAVYAASRRHARATLALAACGSQRSLSSLVLDATLLGQHALRPTLRAQPRPLAPLRTLRAFPALGISSAPQGAAHPTCYAPPALPGDQRGCRGTGGGAEHEDPCKDVERTMPTMRCRRGARSRGHMRVPDRSVVTGWSPPSPVLRPAHGHAPQHQQGRRRRQGDGGARKDDGCVAASA